MTSQDQISNDFDYRITSILTEHFGYPPLAVIDDVINAVNHILYKCTQAMESYLVERQQEKKKQFEELNNSGGTITPDIDNWVSLGDEINLGTAKLETLLENQVDKNFDKFELYALRNIFTIPIELVNSGNIRLEHHENIDFHSTDSLVNDDAINILIKEIKLELKLREILKLQITKGTKLVNMLIGFNENLKVLKTLDNNKLSDKSKEILKVLNPIEDNLYFILTEINSLIDQINKLFMKFEKGKVNLNFKPNLRDFYINGKSYKLLRQIGIELNNKKMDLLAPEILVNKDDLKLFQEN